MTELGGRDRTEGRVATGRSFGSGLSASRQNRRSARCRRRRPCARCRIQDRELGKQHVLRHECAAFGGISVEQQGPLAVTQQNDPCRCEFHGRDRAGRRAGGLRWPQPIALAGSVDDRDGHDRPLAKPIHAGVGRYDAARGANIERICVTTATSGIRCDIGLPGEQESRRTREPRCELNHRTLSTPRKAPVFHVRMSTLSVVLKRQQTGEVPRAQIAHDATAPPPPNFFLKKFAWGRNQQAMCGLMLRPAVTPPPPPCAAGRFKARPEQAALFFANEAALSRIRRCKKNGRRLASARGQPMVKYSAAQALARCSRRRALRSKNSAWLMIADTDAGW